VSLPAPLAALLLAEPERAGDVPVDAIPAVLGELEILKARLLARLTAAPAAPAASNGADQLLTLEQAAVRLSVSEDWLRRQKALLFRIVVSAGQVRYSAGGLERFIARRAGT
jgi:hypothetical protein